MDGQQKRNGGATRRHEHETRGGGKGKERKGEDGEGEGRALNETTRAMGGNFGWLFLGFRVAIRVAAHDEGKRNSGLKDKKTQYRHVQGTSSNMCCTGPLVSAYSRCTCPSTCAVRPLEHGTLGSFGA